MREYELNCATLGTNAHTHSAGKIGGIDKRETNLGQDLAVATNPSLTLSFRRNRGCYSHSLSSQGNPGNAALSSSAKAVGGSDGSVDGSARTESRHGSTTVNSWTDAYAARRYTTECRSSACTLFLLRCSSPIARLLYRGASEQSTILLMLARGFSHG